MIQDSQLFDSFLADCRSLRYSERTIEEYLKDWRAFLSWSMQYQTSIDVRDLTRDIISGYLSQLSTSGYAAATIRRRASVLRSFSRWLSDGGFIDSSPCAAIKLPKIPHRGQPCADEKAVRDFISSPVRPSLKHVQLIVAILYVTGMRLQEVLSLSAEDFDFELCLVRVIGKGNKERLCAISSSAAFQLSSLLGDSRGRLFPGLNEASVRWEMIRQIKGDDGRGVTPHAIRRLYASRCIDAGMPIKTLSVLMGHKSVTTTERYLYLSSRSLVDAVERFAPRF